MESAAPQDYPSRCVGRSPRSTSDRGGHRAPTRGRASPREPAPGPVWLWCSDPEVVLAEDVDRLWQMFLRRFDLEHTFRLFKQTLGWTCPKIRSSEAADRWTCSCSSRTPSCAWPGPWPRTCVVPGRNLHRRNDCPRPGSAAVSAHPPGHGLSGRCAETLPARSRTAARLEKRSPRTPSPRGQTRPDRRAATSRGRSGRLKIKLIGLVE